MQTTATLEERTRRAETLAGVEYEVLSSKRTHWYTVHLLQGVAIDCECDHFIKGHKKCGHMDDAEKAERQFQRDQQATKPVPSRAELAPLNGDRSFRMMK